MAFEWSEIFDRNISKDQARDTGMALVLVFLLIGFATKQQIFYTISIPFLVIDMIAPGIFYPFAILWLGLSRLLGLIVSRIILFLIFFGFVVPVGLIRRLMGKDPLQLKGFKSGRGSVMRARDHLYVAEDLEHPY